MTQKLTNSKLKSATKEQLIPLILTVVTAGALILLIFLEVTILNKLIPEKIHRTIQWNDVLIGLTIYLKTSVDFAIFIGNLMANYKGVKNRIAIEIGTAAGNAFGTILILAIWDFFKEVKPLLAVMIVIAALVLLKLAEESLEHIKDEEKGSQLRLMKMSARITSILTPINNFFHKGLRFIVPNLSMKPKKGLSFWGLVGLSITIPFILGLDDFAGYVPLFNVVNVLGFSIGVILGHMVLNIFLFLSPKTTIKVVKNPVVSIIGSVAFIILALYGFYEVFKILFLHH